MLEERLGELALGHRLGPECGLEQQPLRAVVALASLVQVDAQVDRELPAIAAARADQLGDECPLRDGNGRGRRGDHRFTRGSPKQAAVVAHVDWHGSRIRGQHSFEERVLGRREADHKRLGLAELPPGADRGFRHGAKGHDGVVVVTEEHNVLVVERRFPWAERLGAAQAARPAQELGHHARPAGQVELPAVEQAGRRLVGNASDSRHAGLEAPCHAELSVNELLGGAGEHVPCT